MQEIRVIDLIKLIAKETLSEPSEECALDALSRVTAYVFKQACFTDGDKVSAKVVFDSESYRRQMQMIDAACEGRYIAVLAQLNSWLRAMEESSVLGPCELTHLSSLHLICLNNNKHRKLQPSSNERIISNTRYVKDVSELGLEKRALNIVQRLGCKTTEDIASCGMKKVRNARGCGKTSFENISKCMRDCGYEW